MPNQPQTRRCHGSGAQRLPLLCGREVVIPCSVLAPCSAWTRAPPVPLSRGVHPAKREPCADGRVTAVGRTLSSCLRVFVLCITPSAPMLQMHVSDTDYIKCIPAISSVTQSGFSSVFGIFRHLSRTKRRKNFGIRPRDSFARLCRSGIWGVLT